MGWRFGFLCVLETFLLQSSAGGRAGFPQNSRTVDMDAGSDPLGSARVTVTTCETDLLTGFITNVMTQANGS